MNRAEVPSFLSFLKSLSQNHWGLARVPQITVNVYRKAFHCMDCLYDTHTVKCKMRSLFAKSLLSRVVGTAPRINLIPGLKGLERNLVISRLSPTSRLLLGHPQTALLSALLLKKTLRKESLKHLIFKILTQFS